MVIGDKITSVSKKSSKKLHSKELQNSETETPKERYISPEKKTTNYWWIKVSIII